MPEETETDGFVLRCASLADEALVTLIKEKISFGDQAWALVESVSREQFINFFPTDTPEIVSDWPYARLFGPRCEVRWKKDARSRVNDVLILTEDVGLRLDGFQHLLSGCKVEKAHPRAAIRVWGSSLPGKASVRAESRLPVQLTYPNNCAEGRIECFYYHAPLGGVQFVRLVGVR